MASSSSSTSFSQPQKKYDVFISFRGEDTRFNFTSHLHEALRSKQIDTYIDYRLEKGEEVWPSLEKAIQDSTLFLVIFSEKYASSTWCLKELSKILECSKNHKEDEARVMPVFYRVDPSHVRKQSGSYQKAFEQHGHKSINNKQLQQWREALSHAANLSGWHCTFDRNEAELIIEIVKCVIHKLDWTCQSKKNLQGLIGIDTRMADVESLLYKDSNGVRCIGIWGMGGMGKTTLAKALFSKLCFEYDGFCFLDNVTEESKKNGIYALKKKLILELLGDKESKDMLAEIPPYAMKRLRRKKFFIVLDDVDDPKQLEDLAIRHDWFGSGSKILITTRDKQVVLDKEVDDIYGVKALNPDEAFDLFSINTTRNDYFDPKIRGLAKKVVHYADGNPLALKVLGSLLNGKNQEAWESQLGKLQKLPCKKINDILKLSFEGLDDDEEKNIFLHIVCFFNQYNVKDVTNWLDACGYSTIIGLERLKDKALLDICEGRICMHNLIKEMGREIGRKKSYPYMRVRIWNSNDTGGMDIEGIILEESEVLEETNLSPQVFRSTPNLRFLIFHKDFKENKLKFSNDVEFLPNKLILLSWEGYPSKSLPATFRGEHLVQIEMCNSKLTKLWDGEPNLVNLCEIDLHGSKDLTELPDFSKALHLEGVNLESCSNLGSVNPSILSLHSLRYLRLSFCKALTSLTSNTHLESLSYLGLRECSRLTKFSVTSENCQFELDLAGTSINDELSSSSGCLSKVVLLSLDRCESVTSLHQLVDLRNLQDLDACGCNKLATNLCSKFDEMNALKSLSLKDCSELFEVPDNINLLSSLHKLNLSGTNIETLPLNIKHLLSLEEIELDGCKRLQSLPELPPSISILSTKNCLSLGTLHLSHTYDFDVSTLSFGLTNCMKLDRQSIKAVEARVVLDINNIYDEATMEYPGERVPEWFMYKSTQSSLTVDIRSIPQPWDGTFICCVLISKSPAKLTYIDAKWFIDGQYACMSKDLYLFHPLLSDHVYIWCNRKSCEKLQRKIEEMKRDSQSNTYHPLLQLQFRMECFKSLDFERVEGGQIKECGLCPTSALEYQNYIQKIQLALQWKQSRKRKYHNSNEFEEFDSEFESSMNLKTLTKF